MGFLSLSRTKKSPTSDLRGPYSYTFSSGSLTTTTMSTTSYSTNDSRPTSRHYDTGFPDSFATCTTSMRHPDAIIDPGFAISAEHIDPAKSLHRSRKSLLRKHRRTISQGKLDEATLNQISSARPFSSLSAADSATQLVDHKSHDAHSGLEQPLKADAESLSRAKDSETTMGLSSGFHYSDDGDHDGEERQKSNIFKKLINKS